MEIRYSECKLMGLSCKFSFFVIVIYILIRIFAIATTSLAVRSSTENSVNTTRWEGTVTKSLSISIIGARLSVNYRHVFIVRTIIESSNAHCRLAIVSLLH